MEYIYSSVIRIILFFNIEFITFDLYLVQLCMLVVFVWIFFKLPMMTFWCPKPKPSAADRVERLLANQIMLLWSCDTSVLGSSLNTLAGVWKNTAPPSVTVTLCSGVQFFWKKKVWLAKSRWC